MENIVVGFDFSSGSANAVDLAIDIANRWHSDIHLVYVKEPNEDEAPIRAEIEQRIEAVRHLFKGIDMKYYLREGKVSEELAAQAKDDRSSLVIVGTHGMSGLKKSRIIGKNTYHTITEAKVPVLSVMEDYNFNKDLENIVLPIDSTATTRQKANIAEKFAQVFGSTIHILGLYTSDTKDIQGLVNNYAHQVSKHLSSHDIKCTTKFVDAHKNITQSTLDYANEIHADMIIIMTEQEKSFSNLLMGSFAQQMLNSSTIPVLSVQPKQINSESK
ncbi:MAG: universal stress protein [Bacteroidales bacterium]|nr:universal stress protein [Bacteroidales bacterium]